MSKSRTIISAKMRAEIALDAMDTKYTIRELCKKYNISHNAIVRYKKQLKENSEMLFKLLYPGRQYGSVNANSDANNNANTDVNVNDNKTDNVKDCKVSANTNVNNDKVKVDVSKDNANINADSNIKRIVITLNLNNGTTAKPSVEQHFNRMFCDDLMFI